MAAAPPVPRPLSQAEVEALIRRRAPQLKLDPDAVLAVGKTEGWSGGQGDGGRSFGPWQLYEEGRLPQQFAGKPQEAHNWAWSQPGVEYALNGMDDYAAGLTGDAAIEALVRKFEIPADPDSQIAKAKGFYGGAGGGAAAAPPPAAPSGFGGSGPAGPNMQAFTSALIAQAGKQPDIMSLLGALKSPDGTQGAAGLPGLDGMLPEPPAPVGNPGDGASAGSPGGVDDLFYTPLGYSIDEGNYWGETIKNHADHGHASFQNPMAMLAALKEAERRGLSIREDGLHDHVDPVHTKGSDHYASWQDDPATEMDESELRRAADFSGDPKALKAFMAWLAQGARG